jgi:poly(A) polymerase
MERIFQELNKMLLGQNSDKAISLLEKSNLLKIILPEVSALKGVKQPPQFHPEGDVFTHTIKTLTNLQNPSQVGVWSALLHDVGKPSTQSQSDRIRFNNHHRISAQLAKKILTRLKSPRDLVNKVYACVDNHMNFMNVTKMRLSTLKKFLARPTFIDELELHRADCLASHGNIENYTFLVEKKKEMTQASLLPKPFVGGKDLIELGFRPGPIFGIILNKIYDLQLDEKFTTADEARQWINNNRNELLANKKNIKGQKNEK